MNSGVEIVLARMATHPEEFYGDSDKWKFIYKEYFRDAMTETEKGAIFDRIKEIRKEEFTLHVMEVMTADTDARNELESEVDSIMASKFGQAPIKREGSKVRY